jgi:hypothetical protein
MNFTSLNPASFRRPPGALDDLGDIPGAPAGQLPVAAGRLVQEHDIVPRRRLAGVPPVERGGQDLLDVLVDEPTVVSLAELGQPRAGPTDVDSAQEVIVEAQGLGQVHQLGLGVVQLGHAEAFPVDAPGVVVVVAPLVPLRRHLEAAGL